jgi:hypothetical protein
VQGVSKDAPFFVSLRGVRGAEMAISGRAGRGTLQTIFFQNLSQKLFPILQRNQDVATFAKISFFHFAFFCKSLVRENRRLFREK